LPEKNAQKEENIKKLEAKRENMPRLKVVKVPKQYVEDLLAKDEDTSDIN